MAAISCLFSRGIHGFRFITCLSVLSGQRRPLFTLLSGAQFIKLYELKSFMLALTKHRFSLTNYYKTQTNYHNPTPQPMA